MITAHLPSGYVLGKLRKSTRLVLWVTLLGAVFPDIDLLWFNFIDNRAFHHHFYWVHIPAFWAGIATLSLPVIAFKFWRYLAAAIGFFLGIALHLCLDTIAGDILWGWPVSMQFTHLITVPAHWDNWILNFIIHPVFALEILIWIAAALLYKKARQ